jgi:hypothetical protein
MRLTLRTLLRYLDDNLDPADAQEVSQKIEQSELASRLVHSIRSVTRKLRLGAPRLSGKGMGLDPNTVAEYLDYTLPADRVPDFEKVCIESDVHLAEVASCHQILTLAKGEPADVDPALRQRIHALHIAVEMPAAPREEGPFTESIHSDQTLSDEPEPPPLASEPPVAESAEPTLAAPVTVEDLESLQAAPSRVGWPSSRRKWVAVVATVASAFLVALIVLLALGPLDHSHPVLGGLLGGPPTAPPTGKQPAEAPAEQAAGAAAADKTQEPQAETTRPGAEKQQSPPPAEPAAPGEKDQDAAEQPAKEPAAGKGSKAEKVAAEPSGDTGSKQQPAPEAKPEAAEKKAPAKGDQPPVPEQPADEKEASTKKPGQPEEEAEEKLDGVGRYLSDQHVLARFNPEENIWFRLPPLEVLQAGDQLLALPTYRPQMSLTPGIQAVIVGPAQVVLQEPDDEDTPRLTMHCGQMLVVTDRGAGSALNIQFGPRQGRVTFASPGAMLAVEARNYVPPGENPETFPAYHILVLHALQGPLQWEEAEQGEPLPIPAGQRAMLIDRERPRVEVAEQKPAWVDSRDLPLIDRDASQELDPLLVAKRPLSLCLQEQVSSRLVEVRALAIRCLGLLNQFDPYINAWNDEDLRSYWDRLVDSARFNATRSPQVAQLVRETFERLRGEDGTQLYRLLWGFSPQQLEQNAAAGLVELLSADSMDLRVLAFANLMRITERSHMYRPEREPSRQKAAILRWHNTLQEGGITYQTPPPTMPERPVDEQRGAAPDKSP